MVKKISIMFCIFISAFVLSCNNKGITGGGSNGGTTGGGTYVQEGDLWFSQKDLELKKKNPNIIFLDTFNENGQNPNASWKLCWPENGGTVVWNRHMRPEDGYAHMEIKDNALVLKAYNAAKESGGKEFRTSGIYTAKTYGKGTRTTARAKLTHINSKAGFPAVWYYPYDPLPSDEWPIAGEIDMMEWITPNPNKAWVTIHYANNTGNHVNPSAEKQGINVGINMADWHTYTCDIIQDEVICYVDGQEVLRLKKGADMQYKFNDNLYNFILNASFHNGSWGGDPEKNPLDSDYEMLVDFMVIEKLNPDGSDLTRPLIITEDQIAQ